MTGHIFQKSKRKNTGLSPVKGASNLYVNKSTGIYYFRGKAGGVSKKISLKTTDRKTADRKILEEKEALANLRLSGAALTVGDAMKIMLARCKEHYSANKLDHLMRTLKRIASTWPGIASLPIPEITEDQIKDWFHRLRNANGKPPHGTRVKLKKYAPSSINKCLVVMRAIFDEAVKRKQVRENLARTHLKNLRERVPPRALPTRSQLDELIALLRTSKHNNNSYGSDAADFIELMTATGMRPGEALRSKFSDDYGTYFHIRGTKTETAYRMIPMFPRLRKFLDELGERRGREGRLLRVEYCGKTIDRAVKEIGAPSVTPNTWHHWFITETVTTTDIPFAVLASWVGHSDGGILLARQYSHMRESTSQMWAKQID